MEGRGVDKLLGQPGGAGLAPVNDQMCTGGQMLHDWLGHGPY